MKRRVIMSMTMTLFLDILNGRARLVLPDDAAILNVQIDHLRATAEVLVTSTEFEEVMEGAMPPEWPVRVTSGVLS